MTTDNKQPVVPEAADKHDNSFKLFPVAFEVGFSVAIPLIVLALVGRLVDRSLGTHPVFLLAGVALAIIVSSILVWRKMRRYLS